MRAIPGKIWGAPLYRLGPRLSAVVIFTCADTMPARDRQWRTPRVVCFDGRLSFYLGLRHARQNLCGLCLFFVCALIALAAPTQAEVVPDLYAVSVPVAEQSPAELQRAANVGLRELVVRISGRSSAAGDSNLAPLFANAARYLEQYRYERSTGGGSPWVAQLRFGSASIDGEMRKAGLPVWGGNRPALQAFLVVEDKGTRTMLDDNSPFANALREQWHRRGLVLHLPRNVSSAVNADDVARLDAAKVGAAAQEHADGLLLGHITLMSSGACESRWLLSLGAQSPNADATGNDLSACVATALDRLVDNLSSQYAIAANSSAEGIVLRISGVANFGDYAAVLNYLRRLAAVKTAQPVLVRGDEVFFQLKVEGGTEQLARQFALETRLTPTPNAADTAQGINTPLPIALSYRWAPARS